LENDVVKDALSNCIVYVVLISEMHFSRSAIINMFQNQNSVQKANFVIVLEHTCL